MGAIRIFSTLRMGCKALNMVEEGEKILRILSNLLKLERLEQALKPTHESFVGVLCRISSGIWEP